eukprot:CAMPEP_0177650700 /NCGR_PEP_ID=MMETSP0447-20121125/12093_1 /TAXON_ID=0 /ORGANISM="Stygamoeba regulata, Strain BSH-02190019" /LENGTH=70 /DNA_ID=CAMNT_0019153609 /DNA_START=334 /DNA_END=546 /DNA_ORIENTATION=+
MEATSQLLVIRAGAAAARKVEPSVPPSFQPTPIVLEGFDEPDPISEQDEEESEEPEEELEGDQLILHLMS